MHRMIPIGMTAITALLLFGCGTVSRTYPPFENLVNVQKVTPDSVFDPHSVSSVSLYTHLKVFDESGKQVFLNAREHPVLFVAYWCPHCQRTLVLLEKNRQKLKELPVVVNMGFQPGTSLKKARQIEHQEIRTLGLRSMVFYYVLNDPNEPKYIPNGFPTVIFSQGNRLFSLFGEHQFDVWQKALSFK